MSPKKEKKAQGLEEALKKLTKITNFIRAKEKLQKIENLNAKVLCFNI
jgi:hypothetical protein